MTETKKSHAQVKSLSQWLLYLENLHCKEIDLGLDRISQVAHRLAIDLSFAKVITVAGTNGKGTTCAFIENALLAEQQNSNAINNAPSVAVYSSPHIEHFNERLRIDKQDIDDQPLITAFEQIEQARGSISLSYYEYTTLAAFLVLMATKPQYIILEVGLGGRLDATNIISADIAVLTTIDIDHVSFLGNDRETIGYEKAGIMRSDKIAVIGDVEPPLSVLKHAQTIKAKAIVRNKDFIVTTQKSSWTWQNSSTSNQYHFNSLIPPYIPLDNVATALTVLDHLSIKLSSEKINHWIEQTKVIGRMEAFSFDDIDVILDVAHNPQAARHLANQLQGKNYNKIHAVVAMMADKDIDAALTPLLTIVDDWYLGNLSIERAASAKQMALLLSQLNQSYNCFDNVTDAFKMACKEAGENDLIVVFGSFFTVAAIRPQLIN